MAHDIFISYSTKDKITADAICHVLEENKMKCWIAPRNITSGKPYAQEIMDAITSARLVVLVFSRNSQESQFVKNEINVAFSNNKPIISFKIDESMPKRELEYFLTANHGLEAYPEPEKVFATLVRDASRFIGEETQNPIVAADVMERARKGEFNKLRRKRDWIYYILLFTPFYSIVMIYMGLSSKISALKKQGIVCLIPFLLLVLNMIWNSYFNIEQRVIVTIFVGILWIISIIYAFMLKDEYFLRRSVLNTMSEDDALFEDLLEEYSRI